MTDLLFHSDSYLQEFDARVRAHGPQGRAVVLDRTAFYPGGGGQPSDTGELRTASGTFPVEAVRREAPHLLHVLGGTDLLPAIGAPVHGHLDWTRRYHLMRTHTALHILCGVVFRDYGALVTGGDMQPLKGRMDFEFATMHADLVRDIEKAANEEIAAAREIRVRILSRDEAFQIPDLIRTKINLLPDGIPEVRIVEIVGLDLQADGGTHVRNTSEVGIIRVADYKSKGAINKRLYIEIS